MQNWLDISNNLNVLNSAAYVGRNVNVNASGIGKAIAEKRMQPKIEEAYQLEKEGKLLELGKGYLQRVTTPEDYAKYVEHMIKIGAPADIFPKIETQEQLDNYKIKATASAEQLIKIQQGKEFEMTKDNKDGTRTSVKVTKDQMPEYIAKGFEIGNVEGTQYKPLERVKEEAEIQAKARADYNTKQTLQEAIEKAEALEQIKAKYRKETLSFKEGLKPPKKEKGEKETDEFKRNKSALDLVEKYNKAKSDTERELIKNALNAIGFDIVGGEVIERKVLSPSTWGGGKTPLSIVDTQKPVSAKYKSPDDVKADYRAGKISKDEAMEILVKDFEGFTK